MSLWEAWQRFGQPTDFQVHSWEEADVFGNVLPWTAASTAQGQTEQHLRYKVYCIAQELQRCREELLFLPQDALNALAYYQYQQEVLAAALAAARTAAAQAGSPADAPMSRGREHSLLSWQARVAGLQRKAVAAFQKAGMIKPE